MDFPSTFREAPECLDQIAPERLEQTGSVVVPAPA